MSTSDFRQYYETYHRLIGEKYLRGYAAKYQRRYLNPTDGQDPAFDVILEIWYPNSTTQQAASTRLREPQVAAEIVADEQRLFDRASNRFFTVDEVDSSF